MPRREDEYWAGRKEPQGIGLCPFCGSSNVYYNKNYESWRCAKCEKSFPSPSYGPGESFEKTAEGERRKESAETAEVARAKEKGRNMHSFRTNRRRSNAVGGRIIKSLVRLVLNLSILYGLFLLVRYSYQLFTVPQEEPLKGSVFLILGLVTWILIIRLSKSRSKHYWLRYKGSKPGLKLTTFSVIVVLLVLTFAGVEPFVGYKEALTAKWEESNASIRAVSTANMVVESAKSVVENARIELFPTSAEVSLEIHKIVNEERNQRGLPSVAWSDRLAGLAQSQADYSAEVGYMVHSDRYAFEGGENLVSTDWGGLSARAAVTSWLGSPPHREYLLSPRVQSAGVGYSSKNGKTFAAWAFDD